MCVGAGVFLTEVNTVKQTHAKIVGLNDLIVASRLHLLPVLLQLGEV